jgi:hypothetical protein
MARREPASPGTLRDREDETVSADRTRETEVRILQRAFARLDPVALGAATGIVCGAGLALATAVLVFRGGVIVGPRLALLAQFFPGFAVTWPGALAGFAYGAVAGFVIGWGTAQLRNAAVALFFRSATSAGRAAERKKFLDYV